MPKLIDRMFPSVALSITAQKSRLAANNSMHMPHPWPTRKFAQLTTVIAALSSTDDEGLYGRICRIAESGTIYLDSKLASPKNGVAGLDTMCGGGSSLLGMMLNGIEPSGSDVNPVAVFASYFSTELSSMVGEFINDAERELKQLSFFLYEKCRRFYSAEKDLLLYVWAYYNKCCYCGFEYPLFYTNTIARGKHFGAKYSICASHSDGRVVISKNSGDEFIILNKRKVFCLSCRRENDYQLMLDKARNGGLKHGIVFVITGNNGKFTARCLDDKDSELANSITDDELNEVLPRDWHSSPDSIMPDEASRDFLIYDKWSDVFNRRQLFLIASAISYLNERSKTLLNRGKHGRYLLDFLSFAILLLALRNNKLFAHYISKPKLGGKFIEGQFTRPRWAYNEPQLDILLNINRRVVLSMRNYSASIPRNIKVNLSIRDALDRERQDDKKYDIIMIDPPYGDYGEYLTQSSFMNFIYRKIRDCSYNYMLDGISNFENYVKSRDVTFSFVNNSRIKYSPRDALRIVIANALDMLKEDGRLVVIFGNRARKGWEVFLESISGINGYRIIEIWPCICEFLLRRVHTLGYVGANISGIVVMAHEADAARGAVRAVSVDERLKYYWDFGFSGYDFWVCALSHAVKNNLSGRAAVDFAINETSRWLKSILPDEGMDDLEDAIISVGSRFMNNERFTSIDDIIRRIDYDIISKWNFGYIYMQKILIDNLSKKENKELLKSCGFLLQKRTIYEMRDDRMRAKMQNVLLDVAHYP